MSKRAGGEETAARLERVRAYLLGAVEHLEDGLHQAQIALVEIEAELHVRQPRQAGQATGQVKRRRRPDGPAAAEGRSDAGLDPKGAIRGNQ